MNHPVSILHAEVDHAESANRLDPRSFEEFLAREGFEVSQIGRSFRRMMRGEVEAFLVTEESVLSELILSFTLNRRSPSQVGAWQVLVDGLTQAGKLQLVDRSLKKSVDRRAFIQMVANSPAWKEFSRKWSWPSLIKTTEDEGAGAVIL